ncbi:MATH and LRR domain-containing protein PFE0570w-like [Aphidius gifuensis]|uniref:MATH and LRR domain-containing protein PFE0570w-like n=1 Tax=Aphidius gifuensis TaxID=684658 RepID=UPI001CDC2188|nr:MATH and LRR domain-containing protein PFE0570w-like [Aphidius gifuensis]
MAPWDSKLRWQLGGNLQPVRFICEFDWRECPSAIAHYIWSEIVTDVVDCVTNESTMWRVISLVFICTILLHIVWTKVKTMNENNYQRELLRRVNFKVQDLELKINILTYKMSHGMWQGKIKTIQYKENNSNDYLLKCIETKKIDEDFNLNLKKPIILKDTLGNFDKLVFPDKKKLNMINNLNDDDSNNTKIEENKIDKVQKRLQGMQIILRDFRDYDKSQEDKEIAKAYLQELNELKTDTDSDDNKSIIDEKKLSVIEKINEESAVVITPLKKNSFEEIQDVKEDDSIDEKIKSEMEKKEDEIVHEKIKNESIEKISSPSEIEIKEEILNENKSCDDSCASSEHDEMTMFSESPLSSIENIIHNSMCWNNIIDDRSDESSDSDHNSSMRTSFKVLDIISEEQSSSSCNERSSTTIIDKNKIDNSSKIYDSEEINKSIDLDEQISNKTSEKVQEISNVSSDISLMGFEYCHEEKTEETDDFSVEKIDDNDDVSKSEKIINEIVEDNLINTSEASKITEDCEIDTKNFEKENCDDEKNLNNTIEIMDDKNEIEIDLIDLKDEDENNIKEDLLVDEISLIENNNEEEINNNTEDEPTTGRTIIKKTDDNESVEFDFPKQEIVEFNIQQDNLPDDKDDLIQLENITFEELKELEEYWNIDDSNSEISREINDKSLSNIEFVPSSTDLTIADTSSLIFTSDYCMVESIESVKPPKEIRSIDEIDFCEELNIDDKLTNKIDEDLITQKQEDDNAIIDDATTIKSHDSIDSKSESFDSGNSTYLDASSKNILSSNESSLTIEKSKLSLNKISPIITKKQIKYSSTSTLPRVGSKNKTTNLPLDNKRKFIKSFDKNETKLMKNLNKTNLLNRKSLKTKSNLNLSLYDKQNLGKNFKSSIDLTQKRSRSYITPRKYDSLEKNNDLSKSKIALFDKRLNIKLKNDANEKIKDMKCASKSSIPILRTRFENPRLINSEENIKKSDKKNFEINENYSFEKEIKNWEKKNNICDNQTVIYVNIITERDNSVTKILDPKTFREYIKNRDLKIQKIIDDDLSDNPLNYDDTSNPKIRTIISTVINEKPSVEVLAKPSMSDVSTSISDLSDENKNNSIITKEEYIALYEILKEDQNFCQLNKQFCAKN